MAQHGRLGAAGIIIVGLLVAACLPLAGGSPPGGDPMLVTFALTTANNQLAFSQSVLRAPPATNQRPHAIHIRFTNTSTNQQHMWVLTTGDMTVAQQVSAAAQAQGAAPAYLPPTPTNILAATDVLDSGETEMVTFLRPAAGTYTYLCTIPGHFQAGMYGTLIVDA